MDLGSNILELFTTGYGSYNKNLQFEVVVLIVALLVFFNHYFRNNYGFVIILILFVFYVASVWLKARTSTAVDFNKVTLYKLRRIQKLVNDVVAMKLREMRKTSQKSITRREVTRLYKKNQLESLFIDANMIHFIDSLSPLFDYNPYEYLLFVKGVNGILRIRREIEDFTAANGEGQYPVNTSEMFQSALELKKKTINNLHHFIYSVPKTSVIYKYIDDIITRYNVLISRNVDAIHTYYKDNNARQGINTRTKFIQYDGTKPYDELDNHLVVPRKSNNKAHLRPETLEFYV